MSKAKAAVIQAIADGIDWYCDHPEREWESDARAHTSFSELLDFTTSLASQSGFGTDVEPMGHGKVVECTNGEASALLTFDIGECTYFHMRLNDRAIHSGIVVSQEGVRNIFKWLTEGHLTGDFCGAGVTIGSVVGADAKLIQAVLLVAEAMERRGPSGGFETHALAGDRAAVDLLVSRGIVTIEHCDLDNDLTVRLTDSGLRLWRRISELIEGPTS